MFQIIFINLNRVWSCIAKYFPHRQNWSLLNAYKLSSGGRELPTLINVLNPLDLFMASKSAMPYKTFVFNTSRALSSLRPYEQAAWITRSGLIWENILSISSNPENRLILSLSKHPSNLERLEDCLNSKKIWWLDAASPIARWLPKKPLAPVIKIFNDLFKN